MKKSEIYRMAQIAVLNGSGFSGLTKLEILRELMVREDLALFTEKQEENQDKKEIDNA